MGIGFVQCAKIVLFCLFILVIAGILRIVSIYFRLIALAVNFLLAISLRVAASQIVV